MAKTEQISYEPPEGAKPLLCSAGSVQKIRLGQKTEPRRVVKPQPQVPEGTLFTLEPDGHFVGGKPFCGPYRCPYGLPGGTLWVRESMCTRRDGDRVKIRYPADGPNGPVKFLPIDAIPKAGRAKYLTKSYVTRPGIYMPKWAWRLWLGIRVIELVRLWYFGEGDAWWEGCRGGIQEFTGVWDRLNAGRGFPWKSNPWVWRICFEVTEDLTGRVPSNGNTFSKSPQNSP